MNFPTYIDGKQIVSEISSGGHAIVYKAWDPVLETFYAIKVMREEAADNADRFLTEAKVLAQIKHLNVPNILSYGRIGECPFIRMEYIDGEDLGNILTEKQKLPLVVAVSIIVQVARALLFAHNVEYEIYGEKRKGIIHRDVKPGNILIGRDGIVKLTDFGIAKVDKLSIHTSSSSVLGTPYYMSPEQLDPPDDGEPLDSRSDIYSLGCVLYECLTGKCQFDAETMTIILNRKNTGKYDTSLLKEYPPAVRKIIATTTAADKESRYSDIDQMIKSLETVLSAAGIGKAEDCVKSFICTGEYQRIKKHKITVKSWILITIICFIAAGGGVGIYGFLFKNGVKIDKESSLAILRHNLIRSGQEVSERSDTILKIENFNKKETVLNPGKTKHQSENPMKKPPVALRTTEKSSSAFKLFRSGHYDAVIQHLSLKKTEELNDTLFLALCGSLISRNMEKAGEIVFSRSIQDGYIYYCRGRYFFNKGKWELARDRFLKSLTMPTIIPCEESTHFYIVNSAFKIFKDKPNISNREFFTAQRREYLEIYCGKSANENCHAIKNLL